MASCLILFCTLPQLGEELNQDIASIMLCSTKHLDNDKIGKQRQSTEAMTKHGDKDRAQD